MIKGIKKKYFSYGNYYRSEAEVFYPVNIEEIREIILFAKANKRKITIAGSFHSFDNQNSGNDIVVSLVKINYIRFNPEDKTIEVGPGASWGKILKEAYKYDCLPFICITGSRPTAGGTLSANTDSVFSSGLGKEGSHCLELDLLTTDGIVITCSRTQNASIFYGVISGLGIMGFIVRIKYRLFYVGTPYKIDISIKTYDNIDDLETKFHLRESKKLDSLEDLKSQSSLFYFDGKQPKVAIFDRKYTSVKKKERHFNLYLYLASLSMLVVRFFPAYANKIMVRDEKKPYKDKMVLKGLDSIYYGTFWAEPDYIWMRIISRFFSIFGYKPKLYQNSYFIPLIGNNVTLFSQKTCELLVKYNLNFAMFDIKYIPKDEPFVLSVSRDQEGFYINTTFFDKTNVENLMAFYAELNDLCVEMKGKMNLVKNLFIDTKLLEIMYAKEITELIELKKLTDKENLIISNFFLEKFPEHFR